MQHRCFCFVFHFSGSDLAMLNSLPASVSAEAASSRHQPHRRHEASMSGAKTSPILHRPRGGQPSNPNALKHDSYAVKHQTPFTGIPLSLIPCKQIQDQSQDVISQAIPELQEKIVLVLQLSRKNRDFRSSLSLLRLGTILINTLLRLRMARYKLQ